MLVFILVFFLSFFFFQEAENARASLFELRAITAAVESSGQKKAEAQVSGWPPLINTALLRAAILNAEKTLGTRLRLIQSEFEESF